jgi:hypothetical protein
MAVTAGSSVSLVSAPQVPGGDQVVPVLQAQDGSFVGTTCPGCPAGDGDIVSFDATGNVRWTVTGDKPYIATDDGGVIGQSGITYDQNGNATGQVSLYTQSWRGYMYTDGDVAKRAAPPHPLADSGSPFAGTNASGTLAAVLRVPKSLVIHKAFGETPQDCYSSVGSKNPTMYAQRNTTYFVADQYGGEMLHMQYRETLQPGPNTTWCPGATTQQNGQCVGQWVANWFEDQYSANPQTGHSEYTQTFWVATPESTQGYAAFYGQIPRIDAYQSSPSSSNSLVETQFIINLNGNTGMNSNGTPIRSCN